MFFHRSLFDILDAYIQSVGDIQSDNAAVKSALMDIEALTDFAMHKVGVALEVSLAQEISTVGLKWADQVRLYPEQAAQLREQAKHELND